MDIDKMNADDLRFYDYVDIATAQGSKEARRKRRRYHTAYFAKALWEARPFMEATECDPDEAKGFAFKGKERARASTLIKQLKEAVLEGRKRVVGDTMLAMHRLAKAEGLTMPPIQYIPKPRELME